MLSATMLRRLWPHAPQVIIDGIVNTAPAVFAKYDLTGATEIAQAMAQFSHECGGGTIREESLNYTSAARIAAVWPSRFNQVTAAAYVRNPRKLANKVYNGRMGNRPGSDDGFNFRGRGGSQVTGREGYEKLSAKTGLDLINHPDLVNEPQYWLDCAVADFVLCGCLPPAKADDVRGVTRRLNGGYIGLTEREAWLARWKRAMATEHEPSPEDKLSHDDIESLQGRLRDLGYYEVGEPDGKWGSRTTGAVAAFQRHEMLPVTGHYDAATAAALEAATARPVSPDRAAATVDDLRDAGSNTIEHTDKLDTLATVKTGTGVVVTAGGVADATGTLDMDKAQNVLDKANQAHSIWDQAKEFLHPIFSGNSTIALGVFLIVAGLAVAYITYRIRQNRLNDHHTGEHAGPSA